MRGSWWGCKGVVSRGRGKVGRAARYVNFSGLVGVDWSQNGRPRTATKMTMRRGRDIFVVVSIAMGERKRRKVKKGQPWPVRRVSPCIITITSAPLCGSDKHTYSEAESTPTVEWPVGKIEADE